jgi:quercetin dioxygenase-like cupin family protein
LTLRVESSSIYDKTGLDDLEPREVEGIEPDLKAVGYQLRPEEMRPSVWEFAAGETNNWHRHEAQEELYFVLDGEFVVTVEEGGGASDESGDGEADETERETFDLRDGEFVVIAPETWRQFEALEDGRLFVVGAPNVKGDAITEDEES